MGLGFTHSDAVVAELLVSSEEELDLPLRMKRQLDMSSTEELYAILNRRDRELVRHLCLGKDPDFCWEYLPNDVRVMLIKRAGSARYEIDKSQMEWIQTMNNNTTQISYNVSLARRDLNACITLMIHEYTSTLLRDPAQRSVPTRQPIHDDITREIELEVAPDDDSHGVLGALTRPYSRFARSIRTFIKFFVLALIAEPEFHRELAYVLTGKFLRRPITFIATRIWIYARILQDMILPFFLVIPFTLFLIYSSTIGRMYKSFDDI